MVTNRPSCANADPDGFSRPEPDLDMLFPLADVPDLVPRRRGGRKLHKATAFRWASTGCRGVKLEYRQVGGTKCTCQRWLAEFFAELTRRSQDGDASSPTPETSPAPASSRPIGVRTASERRRAAEAADRELARLGV